MKIHQPVFVQGLHSASFTVAVSSITAVVESASQTAEVVEYISQPSYVLDASTHLLHSPLVRQIILVGLVGQSAVNTERWLE